MTRRKPLTFDSKTLSTDLKESAGQGVDALFSPYPAVTPMVKKRKLLTEDKTPNNSDTKTKTKKVAKKGKVKNKKAEQPNNRDAMKPRNHDTTVSRYHDTIIEQIRKAVKKFGKDAATHRFTSTEKKAIADIIYAYKSQSVRTSENEITRIAVNFIINDYQENGKNSILDKVLKVLNE